MEKNKSGQLLMSILGVAVLVVAVVGVSYAFFTYSGQGQTSNTITTGTLSFSYAETVDSIITIENALPTTDEAGIKLSGPKEVFKFSVSGNATGANIAYEVSALNTSTISVLPENAVKLYLTQGTNAANATTVALAPTEYSNLLAAKANGEKSLYKETITNGTAAYSKFFELRMWISSDIKMNNGNTPNEAVQGKNFKIKINVNAINA